MRAFNPFKGDVLYHIATSQLTQFCMIEKTSLRLKAFKKIFVNFFSIYFLPRRLYEFYMYLVYSVKMIDQEIHPNCCSTIFDVSQRVLKKTWRPSWNQDTTTKKRKKLVRLMRKYFFLLEFRCLETISLPLLPLVECFYLKYKQCNVHTVVNLALVS